MKLQHIVCLANHAVKLRFLAMERSLRSTGCDLPLLVIPYDDTRFDLPPNAQWWELPELSAYLHRHGAHPTMRKYQCLTLANYQFVDADVCFLRDPQHALAPHSGFITSCGHWHNPDDTCTAESLRYLSDRSTIWQENIFNTGQFACDRALFTLAELITRCEQPDFFPTVVAFRFHEQPGLNLLVNSTDVPINNLTLPPYRMQSTWAGDYLDANYRRYWKTEAETPCFIHWAGCRMDVPRPINEIFLNYLTVTERQEWAQQVAAATAKRNKFSARRLASRIKRGLKAFGLAVTAG
jgi:hypothetical protein